MGNFITKGNFIALFTLVASTLNAQPWFQTVYQNKGTDEIPYDLEVLYGTGSPYHYSIYMTGASGTNSSTVSTLDLLVMETNEYSNLLFSETFGNSSIRDVGQCAVFDNQTLFIGGLVGPSSGNDGTMWRFDASSNTMIDYTFYNSDGATNFRSIVHNGTSCVIGGPTMMTSAPNVVREFGLLEVDPSNPLNITGGVAAGDPTPSNKIHSARNHIWNATTNEYFQVGYEQSSNDAWFMRADGGYGVLDLVRYNYPLCNNDISFAGIEQLTTSTYLILGQIENCSLLFGGKDILLLVVDDSGNILNQAIYGEAGDDIPRAVRISTANGVAVITGTTNSFSSGGDHDVFMMAVDPTLTITVAKTFPASSDDELMAGSNTPMQLVEDSLVGEAVLIAAYQDNSSTNEKDVLLIKSPLQLYADESCVEYPVFQSTQPSISATAEDIVSTPWGNAINSNYNNVDLALSEAEFCVRAKTTTSTGNSITDENTIKLYPNPAIDIVQIDFSTPTETSGTISLFDISGRLLIQEQLSANTSLKSMDLTALSSGMYFVKIQFDNGESQELRIQKD
ncbi:MAG: hypothetical protein CL843_19445 [Crocinitomicaceae bacterium]|nr:hypothetical protein [Crocinitomicaceae bacterium]|tara:strand:+ start:9355 stop:11049 length:1695 start_codon:yes stop_codon:yes gene_type:complete